MLIAIDLDGTLLDGAGLLTARTVAAVRSAAQRGHRLVLATGRPPHMVAHLADDVAGSVSHVVATNGSVISTFPSRPGDEPELLHLLSFDIERAVAIIERLRGDDDRIGFAFASDAGFGHEPGFAERLPSAVHDPAIVDVRMVGGTVAFKLFAFHPEFSAEELMRRLPPLVNAVAAADGETRVEEFAVAHMGADAVEIGPAGTDKGAGLRWLCEHLGVDRNDVIAIGDERNDRTMIEWAGHGVAMANAEAGVRSAADEVIGANTDDGVARFLERLVSQNRPG